jgi:hypothetical protein
MSDLDSIFGLDSWQLSVDEHPESPLYRVASPDKVSISPAAGNLEERASIQLEVRNTFSNAADRMRVFSNDGKQHQVDTATLSQHGRTSPGGTSTVDSSSSETNTIWNQVHREHSWPLPTDSGLQSISFDQIGNDNFPSQYTFPDDDTGDLLDSNFLSALHYSATSHAFQNHNSAVPLPDLFGNSRHETLADDMTRWLNEVDSDIDDRRFRDVSSFISIDSIAEMDQLDTNDIVGAGPSVQQVEIVDIGQSLDVDSEIFAHDPMEQTRSALQQSDFQDIELLRTETSLSKTVYEDQVAVHNLLPTAATVPLASSQLVLTFDKPKRYALLFQADGCRTRKNKKKIVFGNNGTGRTGKERCEACRVRRSKVRPQF